MSIADTIVAKAASQKGIKENPAGSNKVKYNTAYYGREVSGASYPWCCAFVWWVFKESGASKYFYGGKKTASCTTLMNYYKSKGQTSRTPKVGSLAFFQFDKDPESEHIGIVKKVNADGFFTSIEGNTAIGNDSNGGEVMERTRCISQVLTFAYPYTTETAGGATKVNLTLNTLKKGSEGKDVKALQILLNGYGFNCGNADGIFGDKTMAAVKAFQRANKLAQDGIVGKDTWTKLLKA